MERKGANGNALAGAGVRRSRPRAKAMGRDLRRTTAAAGEAALGARKVFSFAYAVVGAKSFKGIRARLR